MPPLKLSQCWVQTLAQKQLDVVHRVWPHSPRFGSYDMFLLGVASHLPAWNAIASISRAANRRHGGKQAYVIDGDKAGFLESEAESRYLGAWRTPRISSAAPNLQTSRHHDNSSVHHQPHTSRGMSISEALFS